MAKSSRDVIIRTGTLADAEKFYGSVLGFAVSAPGAGIIGFETGSFCLYVEKGPEQGPVFDVLVADVEATKTQLLAAGRVLVEEDRSVPKCYGRDPFGLTFNSGKASEP